MELTCYSAKRHFTEMLDGQLRGSVRVRVAAHLRCCDDCSSQYEHLSAVKTKLGTLAQPEAPPDLKARLQVTASHERALVLRDGGSRLRKMWRLWKLRIDEFMRPLALPATGGLLSTMVMFGTLVVTISTTTQAVVTYEVPVPYYTNRIDAIPLPVQLGQESVTLTMNMDGAGRMKGYEVADGTKASFAGDPSHASVSIPALSRLLGVAEPISGNIQISFQPLAYRQ
jgi:hypothetical protein